ncbi:MAG: EAL domain-containing protein [Acidobacteriota bacterium]|nr:EAL domain-containing protein [Acidobacteriota bacterium]
MNRQNEPTGFWSRARNALRRAWRGSSAATALPEEYRAQQYHAFVMQLPVVVIGGLCSVGALVYMGWSNADHRILVAQSVIQLAAYGTETWLWRRRRGLPPNTPVARRDVVAAVTLISVGAFSYSSLAIYLFERPIGVDRLLLIALVVSLTAIASWLFASLPAAGIAWAVTSCAGLAGGIAWSQGGKAAPLAGLLEFLGVFCVIIIVSVLMTSRALVARVHAEHEIERQRQLLGLVLDDFEEHASDWLWEADALGRFRRVSTRLAQSAGSTAGSLIGTSVVQAMHRLAPSPLTSENAAMLNELQRCFDAGEAFRDAIVRVTVDGQARWWSITAKPLVDAEGRVDGWRGVGSDVTMVHERQVEMRRLATTDSLTGLANRHLFTTTLKGYFTPGRAPVACTVLLIDLDQFKSVNDSLGHPAGDRLLRECARRLHSIVGTSGLLARLGGDEFAILIPRQLARKDTETIAAAIHTQLVQPLVLEGQRLEVRASIGAASSPRDAATAEDLLKDADLALYAAKAAGRSRLGFFDKSMSLDAEQRLHVLSDLRDSLVHNRFELHYQPQANLALGRVVGFEALIRWQHPTRGRIAPAEFIPMAEESGLIVELGEWVLRAACEQAVDWPSDLIVAVNVSSEQLTRGDFVALVSECLATSRLPSNRLELEVTESALIQDGRDAELVLRALRQLGVRISLDDFGTGYSSLAYLQRLPIDRLKIDQSFVAQLPEPGSGSRGNSATAIIAAIIQLAQALRLDTLAEGIETADHYDTLRALGSDHGQGYYLSRPLDGAAMTAYLAAITRQTRARIGRVAVPV